MSFKKELAAKSQYIQRKVQTRDSTLPCTNKQYMKLFRFKKKKDKLVFNYLPLSGRQKQQLIYDMIDEKYNIFISTKHLGFTDSMLKKFPVVL